MSVQDLPSNHAMTLDVIMLNTRFPRLPGDIGNPVSFTCPVLYETVDSASVPAVVSAYIDDAVVNDLVMAGQSLIARGAELLSTSCGFVCAIHDRLQARLSVPLVSSALNLIPWLCNEVTQSAPVGVLTFDARTLSRAHFGRFWRDRLSVRLGLPVYDIHSAIARGRQCGPF